MGPAPESVSSLRAGTALVRALRALRFAAWTVALGGTVDVALLLHGGSAPSLAKLHGWVASLGYGLLVLAPLCALLVGLSAALQVPRAAGRALRWSQGHEAARVGALIAALATSGLLGACAFALTERVILGMARPAFAAAAIVGLCLALLLLGLALFALAKDSLTSLVQRAARTPLHPVLATPLRLLVALSLIALLGALGACIAFWSTLRFLPWDVIGSVLLALLGATLASAWTQRLRAPARRATDGLLAGLMLAACASLIVLDRGTDHARSASRETVLGKLGQAVALRLFDVDRDGYLAFFGGGDCAAFDPDRNPGAIDRPENGIDEDCDGKDLTRGALLPRLRHDLPVPSKLPKRPPIVLITIDTFAASRMQAIARSLPKPIAGQAAQRVVTPQLDAFAKHATLFRKCFAQGPSTRLSFPSIFTSRWDSQIAQRLVGRHPYPIEASELLLAEVLRDAGYDTIAVVPDPYFNRRHWQGLLQGFTQVIDTPLRDAVDRVHSSHAVTDAATKALQAKRDKPLFLWAHYYDAHSPHTQPPSVPRFGTKLADVYDSELAYVDSEVGRLLAVAEASLGQGAVRIVTADHGIAFDAPRHAKLNYGYDLSSVVLHVPLLIAGDSVRHQTLDGLVSTMDIAPTIANLLRIKKRLPFRGASLVPELFEGKRQRPERLHHQFFLTERKWEGREPLELASVRTERYSLVSDRTKGTFELYDYLADYLESTDLAAAPERRSELDALKQLLALYLFDVHRGDARRRDTSHNAARAERAR